ncbi:arginase family protein [Glaciibacter flavus]|uniref:Arginase family protein n=1 Tax=Orlajensenia flava TaxID=2565934 RepID=A0A4S4FP98_9MICO|nr:arginase family protein [Glaciibacter flavus]THG28958.1 arginase family protein [Glaciibacter flavus]THG32094.1 arginase family protein [Glaciibacter flavus]
MIALVSAPSNLGLRPPQRGSVPGAAKAPEALREAGLFRRLLDGGAVDAGVLVCGRYLDDDDTRPAGHVRNEAALVDHARRLAVRLMSILDSGDIPLVIGGDCSVLIGIGLALSQRGGTGLVHVDGHTDFRHPGNSDACASVAGEDLAAAVGLHWPAIADIDGRSPYFDRRRTVHIGHRNDDEEAPEAREALGLVVSAADAIERNLADVVAETHGVAGRGYWLQVDVDVLDASIMPAVDSPDPGGLDTSQLAALLTRLAPDAIGASVTVFDPDLDPDGRYAELVTEVIVAGLSKLGTGL